MKRHQIPAIPSSEITPQSLYLRRREFLALGAAAAAGLLLPRGLAAARAAGPTGPRLAGVVPGPFRTDEPPTSFDEITGYSNFYEFGTSKGDPAKHAHNLTIRPWALAVEGEVKKPQSIDFDTLMKWFPLEERVYRLRCVEGWSMVIPWVGFPLGALVRRIEPTGSAKYVAFTTLLRPEEMRGQARPVLGWPYAEGLRLDEAMHPLTLLAVGLYGVALPKENGAPLRLVVPWKYGFKSIKSIVAMRLVATQPATSWNRAAPNEYGFYANVNPDVPHPRWSQATERRLGDTRRRETRLFNGYAEQVASLYGDLDLRQNF